jgi:hypothetical protein
MLNSIIFIFNWLIIIGKIYDSTPQADTSLLYPKSISIKTQYNTTSFWKNNHFTQYDLTRELLTIPLFFCNFHTIFIYSQLFYITLKIAL